MCTLQPQGLDQNDRLVPAPDLLSSSTSGAAIAPLVKSSNLSAQAYEHIKAAIVAGQIQPGSIYSVVHFADLLGVSRTPVREALLTLTDQGLLEVVRNRGYRVVPMTRADLDEIIEIREMLEVPAMRKLARLSPRPEDVFEQARQLYEPLQMAADNGDLPAFLSLDRKFHLMLVGAVGNDRLTDLIGKMRDHMHLPGLQRLAAQGALHESGEDHIHLLEAIVAGDAASAAALMKAHLARTRREWS